jgi:ribonuclease HI
MSKKWYAVAIGRTPGIYRDWNTTKLQVNAYSGAQYQGFSTEQEAQEYLGRHDIKIGTKVQDSKIALVPSDTTTNSNSIVVYTDGSGEGGKFGFGGVIIDADGKEYCYSEPLPSKLGDEILSGTNNQAELYAILFALMSTKGNLQIYTDSQYAIGCLRDWWPKWQKNNWVGIKNVGLIKYCLAKMVERTPTGTHGIDRAVTFNHVKAHVGNKYNEMADKLAKQGASRYRP